MKSYLLLCLILFTVCAAKAQTATPREERMVLAVYGDYRRSNLRWSIAGNSDGQNPNILSEVHWRNLKLRGIGLDVQVNIWSGILLKGKYYRGTIYSGDVTDTDYSGNNRTDPTYQAMLNSDKGYSGDYAAALAYRFKILSVLAITPYAGYHKSRQSLWLKEFNDQAPAAQKTLNSTYRSHWAGPMTGFDASFNLTHKMNFKTSLSYSQIKYKAAADWNLIDAFAHPVSFIHTANGYEASIAIQLEMCISKPLSAFISGNYTRAETGKGTDELFLVDGRSLTSRFNAALSSSKGAGIGICYHF